MDFETANRSKESACQIAMVRIDSGRVVDRFTSPLAPPAGFDSFEFTYLHGIGPGEVGKAPSWAEIAAQVKSFSNGLPVFAQNASFDAGVWAALDKHFATRTLPENFYCSYLTARHLQPGLKNYKLPTLVVHFVPDYRLEHHNAVSDAEACALIVLALQRLAASSPG